VGCSHPPRGSDVLSTGNELVRWQERVRVSGVETFRVGRMGDKLVAEWPGTARLTCDADGGGACLVPRPKADRRHVEKLRTGAVRALIRDLEGELGLHAAAVALNGRAVLFVGPSGVGKSTAAAELCMRQGALLLADDVASLEVRNNQVRVLATERYHTLTFASCRLLGRRVPSGAARGKVSLRPKRLGVASYPVVAVALLRFDNRRVAATIRPLGGAEAAGALVKAAVRFDLGASRHRELDQVLTLYRSCRVVEIVRPRTARQPSLLGPALKEALDIWGLP
jgi:hypothetical protein